MLQCSICGYFIPERYNYTSLFQADTTLPDGVKPYDLDEDPNCVSEYADSIFRNMKKRELKFAIQNYLIQEGSETTGAMRAILVDWLVEVQENFELYHDTLYLAVKITDFYLQYNPTPKELLQLVGATALLLSCKIEVILSSFFLCIF